MSNYHWINDYTGEIRKTIWSVIFGDLQDRIWCVKNGHRMWKRKWRYSRKGF